MYHPIVLQFGTGHDSLCLLGDIASFMRHLTLLGMLILVYLEDCLIQHLAFHMHHVTHTDSDGIGAEITRP